MSSKEVVHLFWVSNLWVQSCSRYPFIILSMSVGSLGMASLIFLIWVIFIFSFPWLACLEAYQFLDLYKEPIFCFVVFFSLLFFYLSVSLISVLKLVIPFLLLTLNPICSPFSTFLKCKIMLILDHSSLIYAFSAKMLW